MTPKAGQSAALASGDGYVMTLRFRGHFVMPFRLGDKLIWPDGREEPAPLSASADFERRCYEREAALVEAAGKHLPRVVGL